MQAGKPLAYIYARETEQQADIAGVLTFDEARRIVVNVAKLPELLGPNGQTERPEGKFFPSLCRPWSACTG
jgi:hypothetical protein